MKCVLDGGVSLNVVRDDLSCVDVIEQTLGAEGREVCYGLLSLSNLSILSCM